MKVELGSLRKQIQKYRRAIGVVAIVLTVIIVLIIAGYWLNWTGFNGYDKVTKEFTPGGQLVKTTSEYQPGKTLWDWLQLLIIPLVLAVGALLFNLANSRTEHQIAKDNRSETALQAYIDKMSELLLEKHLRTSQTKEDDVREVARVRTLRVLPGLDDERKRNVIQFLHESHLICKDNPIILLKEADLRKASLDEAELKGANLSGAKLMGADLTKADLREADLSNAKLQGANLNGADLSGANLSGANLKDANYNGLLGVPTFLPPKIPAKDL